MECIGPRGVQMMIEYDKYIINLIFHSLYGTTVYPEGMSKEKVAKVERLKRTLGKALVPVLGMVRSVSRRFPETAIRAKLTPEWFMKRGKTQYPEIVEVINENGARGREWLKNQTEEIVLYATGRLAWDGTTVVQIR